MNNLYILGASGAVGQIYTQSVINLSIYNNIYLITSSNLGYERLTPFCTYDNISLIKVEDIFNHTVEDGNNFFVNFAFAQGDLPWVNITNGKKLLRNITNFVKKNNFTKFIEISSQSVFGYNFSSDVSYLTEKPYFVEDYGLQKSIAENIVISNLSGVIPFSILRLGNVLFNTSGPFYQRILQIYHSEYKELLNSDGYTNFTFIENVVSVINYIFIELDSSSMESVYHISEGNYITWKAVYDILNDLDSTTFSSFNSNVNRKKPSKIINFLKSPYSRPIFDILVLLNNKNINYLISNKYRLSRQLNYPSTISLDESVSKSFGSNHRFLPYFPCGFRFEISPPSFFDKLLDIYSER